MEESLKIYVQKQFRNTGYLEAFTPDLISEMATGKKEIVRQVETRYGDDTLKSTLYLRRPDGSEMYFLNKIDANLLKEGQLIGVKQSFYPRQVKTTDENGNEKRVNIRTTQKEAYNLLSGRPVFQTLAKKNDEIYEAWRTIDFTRIRNNGDYEFNTYQKNYGFDLEKTFSMYNLEIHEKPQYKNALVESIERGNLQKTGFINTAGEREEYLISPNISSGYLHIYDLSRTKLTIGQVKELGLLKERGPLQNIENKNADQPSNKEKLMQPETKPDNVTGNKKKQKSGQRI
ncbi:MULTISPECIES: hypothetical protein [Chitinophagaceae]